MAKKLTEEEQETWEALNADYDDPLMWDGVGVHWFNDKPVSPVAGQAWFDVDNNEAYLYDGKEWIKMIGP